MHIVITSLLRTARVLLDRKLWAIFVLTAILNTLVWVGLLGAVWYLIHDHTSIQIAWISALVESASFVLSVLIAILLFPLTFPLVIILFEEHISIYIERQYYHSISSHSLMDIREKLSAGLKFFGVMLLLNILLIPFYFIPLLNIVLYYVVNGYLLGREMFEMVASRYLAPKTLQNMRKKHRWPLLLGGMVLVAGAAVPGLNLVMPVLSVIFMVHFYHNIR